VDAEDIVDGLAQRLAAIEHDEHALVDVEAAAGEVRQQRRRDGRVLGGPVPEPQRVLGPVGVVLSDEVCVVVVTRPRCRIAVAV
jgi:hypothetical protein